MDDNGQAQDWMPAPEVDATVHPRATGCRHWLGVLGLVAFVVGYYFDYLIGRAFIWEDLLRSYYPTVNYLCSSLAAGRFPLWQPGLMNGIPFYTDVQTAIYYPFTWLMVPLVRDGTLPFLVFQWYIVLHILMGGLFMYALLKHHRLGPLGCLAGSLIFCFSGFGALHVIHLPMLEVYAWLPLQFLLVDKLITTPKARYYAWLTLVIFLSFAAGFPQTTLYDSYLVVAYWLFRRYQALTEFERPRLGQALRQFGGESLRMAGVFGSALLLGAIILLPTLEHWQQSERERWDYQEMSRQSMPPHYALQFAVPNYLGTSTPQHGGTDVSFWGYNHDQVPETGHPGCWQYWEFGGYAGQLSLIALAGVLFQWRRFRRTPVVFLVVAAGLALWFMLGRFGGLFGLLYHTVPGISMFRSPARMAGILDFCLAMLVAFWVHSLTTEAAPRLQLPVGILLAVYALLITAFVVFVTRISPQFGRSAPALFAKRQTLISIGFFIGTAVCLAGLCVRRSRFLSAAAAVGLVVCLGADLAHAYAFFHRGETNPTAYFNTNAGLFDTYKKFVSVAGPIRLAQGTDTNYTELLVEPNVPLIRRELETDQGYLDLVPHHTAALEGITNREVVLDLENVGLVVGANTTARQGAVECRYHCLPRVLFYDRIKVYNFNHEIRHDLDSGTLNYRTTLAIRTNDLAAIPVALLTPPLTPLKARVRLITEIPERYRIWYSTDGPGVIFISESFYPGWEAVDSEGRPLPLVTAFSAFKGIVLDKAGTGEITVRFRPPVFRLGAWISGLTALVLAVFYFVLDRREQDRVALPQWERGRPQATPEYAGVVVTKRCDWPNHARI